LFENPKGASIPILAEKLPFGVSSSVILFLVTVSGVFLKSNGGIWYLNRGTEWSGILDRQTRSIPTPFSIRFSVVATKRL
jgi:hypothetical protein